MNFLQNLAKLRLRVQKEVLFHMIKGFIQQLRRNKSFFDFEATFGQLPRAISTFLFGVTKIFNSRPQMF